MWKIILLLFKISKEQKKYGFWPPFLWSYFPYYVTQDSGFKNNGYDIVSKTDPGKKSYFYGTRSEHEQFMYGLIGRYADAAEGW